MPTPISQLQPAANNQVTSGAMIPVVLEGGAGQPGQPYRATPLGLTTPFAQLLASVANAGVGAGMVGYDENLIYAPGTVGYALQQGDDTLAQLEADDGSSLVTYRNPEFIPNNVAHSVQTILSGNELNIYEFLTDDQIADCKARTESYDLTLNIIAWKNACASQGRRGYAPAGTYAFSGKITCDPLNPFHILGDGYTSDDFTKGTVFHCTSGLVNAFEPVYSYAQWAPGGGADAHRAYDIANGIIPLGNSDNLCVIEGIALRGPGVTAATTTQSIQLYAAGPEIQPTGNGFFCYWANALDIRDVWISEFPGIGATGFFCFNSRITRGYQVSNAGAGIAFYNTNNNFTLTAVRCIANCMKTGPFINYNAIIGVQSGSPTDYPNFGALVESKCDFEGAGTSALPGYSFSQAQGNLTSINVSGGTATAVTTGTINIAVGHFIAVTGGTVANGTSAINTIRYATVLTKVGNTITWATSAPNGTYTNGVKIGPFAAGLGLQNCQSTRVDMYSETTTGPALYISKTCRSVAVRDSFMMDGKIYVEGSYFVVQQSVQNAGSGYTNGNTLTASGGTLAPGGTAATFTAGVSAGAVIGLTILNPGSYLVPPTNPVSLTGGTGTLARANLNWFADSAEGTSVHDCTFLGTGTAAGIWSDTEVTQVGQNTYKRAGSEVPGLYLGPFIAAVWPTLAETGATITLGQSISRGVNRTISDRTPAHISNTAVGIALTNLESATSSANAVNNTAVGYRAGVTITNGASNVLIGNRTGEDITTGGRSVIVGDQTAGTGGPLLDNFIGIGYGVQQSATSNAIRMGNTSIGFAGIQVAWTVTSDEATKEQMTALTDEWGLPLVNSISPKRYRLKGDTNGKWALGFGANELRSVLPDQNCNLVVELPGQGGLLGMRPDDLIPILWLAIRQLTARVQQLEAQ